MSLFFCHTSKLYNLRLFLNSNSIKLSSGVYPFVRCLLVYSLSLYRLQLDLYLIITDQVLIAYSFIETLTKCHNLWLAYLLCGTKCRKTWCTYNFRTTSYSLHHLSYNQRLMKPSTNLALFTQRSLCKLNRSLWASKIPKSRIESTLPSLNESIKYFVANHFRVENDSFSHYLWFSYLKFKEHRATKLFISGWSRDDWISNLTDEKSFTLSVYIRVWADWKAKGRSLMYRINSIGSKWLPCETPEVTRISSDL